MLKYKGLLEFFKKAKIHVLSFLVKLKSILLFLKKTKSNNPTQNSKPAKANIKKDKE